MNGKWAIMIFAISGISHIGNSAPILLFLIFPVIILWGKAEEADRIKYSVKPKAEVIKLKLVTKEGK